MRWGLKVWVGLGISWAVFSPAEDHSGWRALNSTDRFCSLSPNPSLYEMKAGGWYDVAWGGVWSLQRIDKDTFLTVVPKCGFFSPYCFIFNRWVMHQHVHEPCLFPSSHIILLVIAIISSLHASSCCGTYLTHLVVYSLFMLAPSFHKASFPLPFRHQLVRVRTDHLVPCHT